jgi:hypothetical protein
MNRTFNIVSSLLVLLGLAIVGDASPALSPYYAQDLAIFSTA